MDETQVGLQEAFAAACQIIGEEAVMNRVRHNRAEAQAATDGSDIVDLTDVAQNVQEAAE